ncbi:MAG: YkvA family protein [Anaerolineaceae bacterium]
MPWYGWLILGTGAFIAFAAITLRLLRASSRGRRFLALGTRSKIRFGRILLGDRRIGVLPKAALLLLVGYLALPFDLIPDFIPVIGQLDDIVVVFGVIALLLVIVPPERFNSALSQAEQEAEARRLAAARPLSGE